MSDARPVALVTGVSREVGIGRAVADRLSADGFVVATAGLRAYDDRMPWGADAVGGADESTATFEYEVDFVDPVAAAELMASVNRDAGPVTALVLCHTESVDSDIFSTTVESFDRLSLIHI